VQIGQVTSPVVLTWPAVGCGGCGCAWAGCGAGGAEIGQPQKSQ
jgi:hypothetical protein